MPATTSSQRIGIDLSALDEEPHGHILDRCALHRKPLLEALMLAVEAARRPKRKAVLDRPAPQPSGSVAYGFSDQVAPPQEFGKRARRAGQPRWPTAERCPAGAQSC